jgi:hypothetical protein
MQRTKKTKAFTTFSPYPAALENNPSLIGRANIIFQHLGDMQIFA